MVTADLTSETDAKLKSSKADFVIFKPFKIVDVMSAIDKLMKRRMGEHTLDAFNYEFKNWSHVCAFTCFVDRVGLYQLESFYECSFAPLARQIPLMLNEEQLHIGFGF